MNLTTDPWIPAVRTDGTRALFSLQGLFAEAHELRDLVVKPHERIALMRLLLCITQAALDGPEDEAAWDQCEPLIQQRVRDYLAKWRGAFELFGEGRRFLQLKPGVVAPATPVMENEGITRLNLSMASGESNATLFDNSASDKREFTAAEAALSLLTYQCYSPLLGRGYKRRSPCADNSMLHTFLIGTRLLGTIKLNLLTQTTIAYNYSRGSGQPVWEAGLSKTPTEEVQRMLTQSYLGRLVPLARAVWLESPTTMTLANGLVYNGFLDSGYREAAATLVAAKNKLFILRARTDRAIWRELPAVCVKNRQADGVSGPMAFRNPVPDSEVVIWAGALISDQAKIKDSVEATYSLPSGLFDDDDFGRVAYENGVKHAEDAESTLIQAVKTHAAELKVVTPAYDRARQHFWTRVEQSLSALFEVARKLTPPDQLATSDWGRGVRVAALDAYEQSCPRQTPRQIQAYAAGLRRLNASVKAKQPKVSKAKNHE